MNLGSSATDIGFLIVFMLSLLIILPLLMWLSGFVLRLLGVQSASGHLLLLLVAFGGLLIGSSLYLDSAGQPINGVVYEKEEGVKLRVQGDWEYNFTATTRYRLDGQPPTTGLLPEPADSSVVLRLTEAEFDSLTTSQPVALKVLPLWRSLTLVRLASSSTRTWVPWSWLAVAGLLLSAGWLAYRLAQTGTAVFLMVAALVLAGLVAYPTVSVYRTWRERDSMAAKPLRATGTVLQKTLITRIDPLPCSSDCDSDWETEFDVPQQYEIVELSYWPEGAQEAITAVSSADLGSVQLEKGGKVDIAYSQAHPRAVQILGATHNHIWRNAIGFVQNMGLSLLAILLVFAAFSLLGWLFRLLWRRALARAATRGERS